MSKYLVFQFKAMSKTGKTEIYNVVSKRHGDFLGEIRWYGPWRGYVHRIPASQREKLFSEGCLRDILAFIAELKTKRRDKNGK